MKNTNRTPSGGSEKPQEKQWPCSPDDKAIDVFSAQTCEGYWREAFNEQVFEAVQAGAQSAGVTLDEFIAIAITRHIREFNEPEPARKVHKNFFLINMSQDTKKELRALAAAFGIPLRLFLDCAVNLHKWKYEELLNIANEKDCDPNFIFTLIAPLHNKN